ncbi:hypothetical protein [Treponema zioleckii]|uniref:hypothetical protein n=1 Tax=Treponema zioleckii TaxID=331680 RepID=UPI00168AEBE3|nr:hypothetical protein [Treponema zioleckii]
MKKITGEMYKMNWLKKLLPLCVLVFCLSGCIFDEYEVKCTFSNDTDTEITILSVSEETDESLPVQLQSGLKKTLGYSRCAENLDFEVMYKEKKYRGYTNYVQDSAKYTIRIYLENGQLKSRTSCNSSIVELTEISD